MAIRVERVTFERAAESIRRIREQVFVIEQHVPPDLEWDGLDERCQHVLAYDESGRAVGTARLTPDEHIGRMAVLAEHRRSGVGSALLQALLRLAKQQGVRRVALNAQTHAIAFYARHGFRPEGDVFEEAGIPHRTMVLELDEAGPEKRR